MANTNNTNKPNGIRIAQAWEVEEVAIESLPGQKLYIFNLPGMPDVTVAAPGYGEFAAFLQAVVRELLPAHIHASVNGVVTDLPGASGKGSTHD